MRDARDGDGNSLQSSSDGLEKFPPPQLFLHLFYFFRKLSLSRIARTAGLHLLLTHSIQWANNDNSVLAF